MGGLGWLPSGIRGQGWSRKTPKDHVWSFKGPTWPSDSPDLFSLKKKILIFIFLKKTSPGSPGYKNLSFPLEKRTCPSFGIGLELYLLAHCHLGSSSLGSLTFEPHGGGSRPACGGYAATSGGFKTASGEPGRGARRANRAVRECVQHTRRPSKAPVHVVDDDVVPVP